MRFRKLMAIITLGVASVSLQAEDGTLFDIKLFDITDVKISEAVEDRSKLKIISNPRMITKENVPTYMELSADEDSSLKFSLSFTPLNEDEYEYKYTIAEGEEEYSATKKAKRFQKNRELMIILDFNDRKMIVEVNTQSIELPEQAK